MKNKVKRLHLHRRLIYFLAVEMMLIWQKSHALATILAAGLYYPVPYLVAIFVRFDQFISQTIADTRSPARRYHEIGDRRTMEQPSFAAMAIMASFGLMLITAISLVAAATLAPEFALYPPMYLAYVLFLMGAYGVLKRLRRWFAMQS